jgi:hypothetical protein
MESTPGFYSLPLARPLTVTGWASSASAADDRSIGNSTGAGKVTYVMQTNKAWAGIG